MSSKNTGLSETKNFIQSKSNYFKGALVFLILFNKRMPDAFLQFCQSTLGKIIFAITIAFFVSFDTVVGLLFTVYYLFIMSEYNNRFRAKVDAFTQLNNEYNNAYNKYQKLNQIKKEPTCRHNFNL